MADAVTDPKAAGWKQDPSGRFAGRYWDGSAWTEHVVGQDRVRSTDPVPAAGPRPAVVVPPPPASSGPAAPVPPARPRRSGLPATSPAGLWRAWPLRVKVALPAVLVVAVVLASTRGGDDAPGGAGLATRTFAVGDTARTDEFDVTVFGFTDPQPPGQFLAPAAGHHYVSVDLQLANRSATQQTFSSLLQIHLLDASNRQYDSTFGEVTPPAPDGEVPAGQAIRGQALFEVPDGTTGLRMRVQGSLTAGGAYFALA